MKRERESKCKIAMANGNNLSSLVHELHERIAASSTQPADGGDADALEIRFRAIISNLLHAYVVPSSSANERDGLAVVQLVAHTARNFPGVFYHEKASAILPVIGRILPFFSEPQIRGRKQIQPRRTSHSPRS